jgi:hypothetical protein
MTKGEKSEFKYDVCIICDKKHIKCTCDTILKHLIEWANESGDQDKHPEAVINNIIQPYGRGYGDALYEMYVKLKEIMKIK